MGQVGITWDPATATPHPQHPPDSTHHPRPGTLCRGLLNPILTSEPLESIGGLHPEESPTDVILVKGHLRTFSASNCWQPLVLQNRKAREFPPS